MKERFKTALRRNLKFKFKEKSNHYPQNHHYTESASVEPVWMLFVLREQIHHHRYRNTHVNQNLFVDTTTFLHQNQQLTNQKKQIYRHNRKIFCKRKQCILGTEKGLLSQTRLLNCLLQTCLCVHSMLIRTQFLLKFNLDLVNAKTISLIHSTLKRISISIFPFFKFVQVRARQPNINLVFNHGRFLDSQTRNQ